MLDTWLIEQAETEKTASVDFNDLSKEELEAFLGVKKEAFYRHSAEPDRPRIADRVNLPSWKRDQAYKQRSHFEDFVSMAEHRKGSTLTDEEINAVIDRYNATAGLKIPHVKDWKHGNPPMEAFEKSASAGAAITGTARRVSDAVRAPMQRAVISSQIARDLGHGPGYLGRVAEAVGKIGKKGKGFEKLNPAAHAMEAGSRGADILTGAGLAGGTALALGGGTAAGLGINAARRKAMEKDGADRKLKWSNLTPKQKRRVIAGAGIGTAAILAGTGTAVGLAARSARRTAAREAEILGQLLKNRAQIEKGWKELSAPLKRGVSEKTKGQVSALERAEKAWAKTKAKTKSEPLGSPDKKMAITLPKAVREAQMKSGVPAQAKQEQALESALKGGGTPKVKKAADPISAARFAASMGRRSGRGRQEAINKMVKILKEQGGSAKEELKAQAAKGVERKKLKGVLGAESEAVLAKGVGQGPGGSVDVRPILKIKKKVASVETFVKEAVEKAGGTKCACGAMAKGAMDKEAFKKWLARRARKKAMDAAMKETEKRFAQSEAKRHADYLAKSKALGGGTEKVTAEQASKAQFSTLKRKPMETSVGVGHTGPSGSR